MLRIRLLGEFEISRGRQRLALPPSKKTRALLAYLAVTARPHRRERLCSLLWELPDDPRGALRWSLSKLRALVDEPDRSRVVADRETVALDGADIWIDLLAIRERLRGGIEAATTERLQELALEFRGEFLEGLALPDQHDFQAWCVAEREDSRELQATVLRALVERLSDQPAEALPHARTLVRIEPFDEPARAMLLRLLTANGRRREAEQEYEVSRRLLEEAGSARGELNKVWRELRQQAVVSTAGASSESILPEAAAAIPEWQPGADSTQYRTVAEAIPLVGRRRQWNRLVALLEETAGRQRQQMLLLTGEPGVGKSRLLAELMAAVRARCGTVLDGRAYEVETDRPYGSWIDALGSLPAAAVGDTLGGELALLRPELAREPQGGHSRDRLFGAVSDLLAARAHVAPPVLLAFDDVQWCDAASAALLHYAVRMNRHRPVMVVLAARDGELQDNRAMTDALRSLRHERLLEELSLEPLSAEETEQLVRAVRSDVDASWVHAESAGNPLFALQLAEALPRRRGEVPPTLSQLVRDRVGRLPGATGDVLRWGAILGQTFSLDLLQRLVALEGGELTEAVEVLERHGLVRPSRGDGSSLGAYEFTHDLVRRAVYAEMSEPRRRFMHLRAAQILSDGGETDGAIAQDIAHHATLAGDAGMAARACVSAGRRCLRLFANAEAETLARRGIHYAERLREPDRVKLIIELMQISLAARRPPQLDDAMRTIEELAERALDHGCLEHARLGFHMLGYMRWEGGDWPDARRDMLRAELVSRATDDRQRMVATAEAARCLALLERDLPQAEALLLEASALAERVSAQSDAIADAQGMLRLHQGKTDEAAARFQEAQAIARRDGDRVGEFQALEHLVMLELQRERYAEACALAEELKAIGSRLRDGSEAPFGQAVCALARYAAGEDQAAEQLEAALEALRLADAKHRLAFTLTRTAEVDLRRGRPELARVHAAEGLRMAEALERPSEVALAHVLLARAAASLSDEAAARRHTAALRRGGLKGVSSHVRQAAKSLMGVVAQDK